MAEQSTKPYCRQLLTFEAIKDNALLTLFILFFYII